VTTLVGLNITEPLNCTHLLPTKRDTELTFRLRYRNIFSVVQTKTKYAFQ